MRALGTLREIASRDPNPLLEAARASGRPVVGTFCSYVPEEVLHAAGCVPYRMRAVGSPGCTRADAWFSSLNCTFVRRCFEKALRGAFAFLDGVVFTNGCDHTRRLYDNWRHAGLAPDFRHMFVVPHVIGENAENRFAEEIDGLIRAVETGLGVHVPEEALRESVRLSNRKRVLLARLQASRAAADPPLRGSEMLAVVLAVTALPLEESVRLLESLLGEVEGRSTARPGDLRLFLASGCLEEVAHLELIESCGAAIVADNLCLGVRHFHERTDEAQPPRLALARRYLRHLSCPRMMNDFRRRQDFLYRARGAFGLDAAIVEKLTFCDLWGGEALIYRKEARRRGLPLLALERELYGSDAGQMRTRVQAFLEQVRDRRKSKEDAP